MKVFISTLDRALAAALSDLTQDLATTVTWRKDGAAISHRVAIDRPDVIFVDLENDHLGAIALLSGVKRSPVTSTRVIAIVRTRAPAQTARLLDTGFDWVIRYPFQPEDISAVLRTARRHAADPFR